jgi:Ni/Co efflux regulator RcnB
MQGISARARRLVALVVVGVLAAGPAVAQGRGHDDRGDKGNKERVEHSRDRGHNDRRVHAKFDDRQQVVIREYYVTEVRRGHCPPGLAKKRNGCQPPGHAKRYAIGRPLPREVIFHEVPRPLIVKLGPPPSGYRYVRVDNDILKIVIGTGLVVDALQNLGKL